MRQALVAAIFYVHIDNVFGCLLARGAWVVACRRRGRPDCLRY